MTDYNRPKKNAVRTKLFEDMAPKTSVLTLPSRYALCSASLLSHGVIKRSTPQQWVENRSFIHRQLTTQIEAQGFTDVETFHGSLEEYTPTRKLDLINADMETSFTEKLGIAFEDVFSKHLLPNASVVLWVTAWARNAYTTDFHDWVYDRTQEPGHILHTLSDEIASHRDCKDPALVLPIVLFTCAMNQFDIDIVRSREYRDTRTTMMAIRFDNIRPTDNPIWPSFKALVAEWKDGYSRERMKPGVRELVIRLEEYLLTINHTLESEDDGWKVISPKGVVIPLPKTIEEIADIYL